MIKIIVYCGRQSMEVYQAEQQIKFYLVSTAKNGVGEVMDSEKTPRGRHVICEKIGGDQAINAVFIERKPTGEHFDEELRRQCPKRDWILTRILRLKGLDPGLNLGGSVDTFDRFIYIHGSPDSTLMGVPGSRGCIRMSNDNMIELFDLVSEGTELEIFE